MAWDWSDTDDAKLVRHARYGAARVEAEVGCSRKDVYRRAKALGVTLKGSKPHWREHADLLEQMVEEGYTVTEISEFLGRSESSVRSKAFEMDLSFAPNYSASKRHRIRTECQSEARWGAVSLASHKLPLVRIAEALGEQEPPSD